MFICTSLPSTKTDVVTLSSSSVIFIKSLILFNTSQDPRIANIWVYTNEYGEYYFGRYELDGYGKVEDSPDYPIELIQTGDAIRGSSNTAGTVNLFVTGDKR